jgi:molybdopterin molybdotransferase
LSFDPALKPGSISMLDMLSVEEARDQILQNIQRALPSEEVPLTSANGRTLAADAFAGEALPAFDNSGMDGYAVRSADTFGAAPNSRVSLRLVGEVPAGHVYSGTVEPGEAVRILTGAAVPDGADSVIAQELTEVSGGMVWALAETPVGANIRPAGDDVAQGDLLVLAGSELGPAEIALLAALGVHPVRVTRRPRIGILSTGDELAPLGETPAPGQIRESNAFYLAAAVEKAGGVPVLLGVARDQADEIRGRLQAAGGCDLILSSGGVSVGDYDLVKQILSEEGAIHFWRVRMRPGKPLAFGLLGGAPFLGLPGNPVSAAVTFELFGRPAIRKLLGCRQLERTSVDVVLEGEDIERADRRHFVRARLQSRDGTLFATTTGSQGSHRLSSLVGATALLVVMEGEGSVHAGDHLQALLLQ